MPQALKFSMVNRIYKWEICTDSFHEYTELFIVTPRPMSASELAVGCDGGVFVWQVDPNSVVTRPSTSCATVLQRPHHSPVTSVTWSPQGDVLLTASAADTAIYVWDVAMEKFVALRRVGGGGLSLVTWSPDGSKVFAATTGIIFR